MSARPAASHAQTSAAQLRSSIDNVRAADTAELTFDQLTETEKNVASLGVSPDSFKPIGFLNVAHYTNLLKQNALSPELTQKIEAYKHVAALG